MSNQPNQATASDTDAIALRVTEYFERPGSKAVVYSTSDANLFENQGFAKDHAATLEDKNVVPHSTVANLEVVEETLESDELSEAQTKLLQSELAKANYKDLKALAAFLKLQPADQKAETLIDALEAYRDTMESGSGEAATQTQQ